MYRLPGHAELRPSTQIATMSTKIMAVKLQYFNLGSKSDRLFIQWESLREEYMEAFIESAAIPGQDGLCQLCLRNGKTKPGYFRCPDCGPMAVYCDECVVSIHNYGQLHLPERWGASINIMSGHIVIVNLS